MELKKRSLQCPICQATYIRKDNLLRHSKKIHSENIAARIPTKEVKKAKPCLSDSVVFNTHFYYDCFKSNNVWNDRMGEKIADT